MQHPNFTVNMQHLLTDYRLIILIDKPSWGALHIYGKNANF